MLLPQNLKSIVLVEFDDRRAFGLAEAVVVELYFIIDRFFDFLADVVIGHRSRMTGEVGRSGGDGLTQAADDFFAKFVVHHADTNGFVGGDVLRKVLALAKDDA